MQSKSRLTDFEIQTKLGSGSYGVIYRVAKRSDRKVYVLKQVNLSSMKEKMRKNAINEATILSRLNNPFIVRYLESFIDQNCLNIIMEYCEGGDLALMLKQQNNRPLKEDKIWKIFLQICLGLEYIHSKRILHRDIKTLNIFLTRDEMVKIGDLGVAKLLHENADFAQTMVGTPFYLSPQLCEEKPYNQKSDIWALGCLLYEMCTYKHPFEAANQGSLILKIVRGRYNPISESYSKQLRQTVDSCLQRDYKRRPTASVLLARPALKLKCEQLGIKLMVDKHDGEESKRVFAMQLEAELNKKEQISAAQQPKMEKKPLAGKINEEVKGKKQQGKKEEIKKEEQKKEQQHRREQQLKKEELQRKEQLRKEQLLRRQELKKEEARKEQQRREEQKREELKKEEQRKREREEQQRKLQIQRKQQAQQLIRRSQEKRKLEDESHQREEPKQVVEKVRYEREVSARVYDSKRPPASSKELLKREQKRPAPTPKLLTELQAPSPQAPRIVIKSKGFSSDDNARQYSSHIPSEVAEPSSVKNTSEKKHVSSSEKKLLSHSNSNQHPPHQLSVEQPQKQEFSKKRNSEPKVLFGAGNILSNQIPPLPPARVRKGAPIEKSRNSQNPIRPKETISKEEQRLVANLPDESSSDEDYPSGLKNLSFKDGAKSNGQGFKLKEVDDKQVLRRYEQLMECKDTQTSQHEQQRHFEPVQEHQDQDNLHQQQEQKTPQPAEQQFHEDSLQHDDTVNYQDSQLEVEYNEPEIEEQEHFPAPHQEAEMQILEEPATFHPANNEWEFDEQPELPAFEQANMLLMQSQQDSQQQTRNYLQDKLSENMKREDELNQLMQLKIDQCRKACKSSYDQIIEFLRKKINMDSEYNDSDEKEIEQFLRSKKLTDAKKFQNIYKIIHFEMELENCRNIIQSICKKLAQLDR